MVTIGTLPKAKISGYYFLDSKFSTLTGQCKDLELPLKLTDRLVVVELRNGHHKQATVGMFLKSGGKSYCLVQHKLCNFYIVVRRGIIDYKITAKDFRLELLKIKGVLK